MSNIRVIPSRDATPQKRKSPAQIIIDSLGDEYETMRSMSLRYGVNIETIRRLCKATDGDGNKKVTAPSMAAQQGDLTIYLFTKEDVAELDEYMSRKGYVVESTKR